MEEESFVILGTSPTPSMESFNNVNKHDENTKIASPSSSSSETGNIDKSSLQKDVIKKDLISSVASTNSDGIFSLLTHSTIKNETNENDNQKINNDEKENKSMNSMKSAGFEFLSTNANTVADDEAEVSVNATTNNAAAASINESEFLSKSNSSLPFTSLKNSIPQLSNTTENNKYKTSDSKANSLAASFLLGDVSMDEIKESVFSQFPSLNSAGAQTDDILKLQNFIMEYNELKDNLRKTNSEMRQYISSIINWKNEMKTYKEEQMKEMENCRELIAKLRNENMELRKELEEKIELVKLNDESMRQENNELRKLVSEKTSLISNLSVQIDKLDQKQHNSFEYIRKFDEDDKDSKFENDYIPMLEHKRILKDVERKLSEIVAENIQLNDMKKTYIDEIDCLKVNLVSAEELLKKAQNDIILLKSKDLEKTELFENYEKDKNEMKQEVNLLRMQLEIYHKDFQMERDSRQKLAGEKDQLLTDLKMLQKRNQQLIEETQTRFDREVNKNSPSSSSYKGTGIGIGTGAEKKKEEQISTITEYTCPLCMVVFADVNVLVEHTQDCIDKV